MRSVGKLGIRLVIVEDETVVFKVSATEKAGLLSFGSMVANSSNGGIYRNKIYRHRKLLSFLLTSVSNNKVIENEKLINLTRVSRKFL